MWSHSTPAGRTDCSFNSSRWTYSGSLSTVRYGLHFRLAKDGPRRPNSALGLERRQASNQPRPISHTPSASGTALPGRTAVPQPQQGQTHPEESPLPPHPPGRPKPAQRGGSAPPRELRRPGPRRAPPKQNAQQQKQYTREDRGGTERFQSLFHKNTRLSFFIRGRKRPVRRSGLPSQLDDAVPQHRRILEFQTL